MSEPPMLEIRKDEATPSEGVVNLLPCRVQHTGSVGPSSAYWNPSIGESECDESMSVGYDHDSDLYPALR